MDNLNDSCVAGLPSNDGRPIGPPASRRQIPCSREGERPGEPKNPFPATAEYYIIYIYIYIYIYVYTHICVLYVHITCLISYHGIMRYYYIILSYRVIISYYSNELTSLDAKRTACEPPQAAGPRNKTGSRKPEPNFCLCIILLVASSLNVLCLTARAQLGADRNPRRGARQGLLEQIAKAGGRVVG